MALSDKATARGSQEEPERSAARTKRARLASAGSSPGHVAASSAPPCGAHHTRSLVVGARGALHRRSPLSTKHVVSAPAALVHHPERHEHARGGSGPRSYAEPPGHPVRRRRFQRHPHAARSARHHDKRPPGDCHERSPGPAALHGDADARGRGADAYPGCRRPAVVTGPQPAAPDSVAALLHVFDVERALGTPAVDACDTRGHARHRERQRRDDRVHRTAVSLAQPHSTRSSA
mmetsp:Transcript_26868/g.79175  ORF Transcript_26868/g.79175 Transcript_26868/m.79175 type:complete len:234 (+) Transcript_26868:447-1148(+)